MPIEAFKRFVRHAAFRISVWYLLLAGGYIFISDNLLPGFFDDPSLLTQYQTYKGWGFVALTGLMLYFLIRQYAHRIFEKEQALQESQKCFQTVTEHARDILYYYRFEPELRVKYINPIVEDFTGITAQEIYDNPQLIYTQVHPDDRQALRTLLQSGDLQTEPTVVRWKHAEDDYIWVEHRNTPEVNEAGKVIGVRGIARDVTEQTKNRHRLEFQADILRNINDAVIAIDLDGTVTYWNQGAEKRYRYTAGEMLGSPIQILHTDQDVAEKTLKKLEENGELRQETQVISGDGSRLWIDQYLSTRYSDEGEPIGYLSVSKDITRRKAQEHALRESKNLYEKTLSALEEAVFVVDTKSREVVSCNPAVERMFQYTSSELIGRSTRHLYRSDEDYQNFGEWSTGILTEQEVFHGEFRMQRKDGKVILTDHTISWLSGDEPPEGRVVSVIRDITELMETREALRESEELFRGIVENMVEGFYRTTPEGKILVVNPQFAQMLGYDTPDKLEGNYLSDFNHFEKYDRDDFISRIHNRGLVRNYQNTWINRDGVEMTVKENAHAVYNRDGEILYFDGTVEDITEQKALEQQLIQAQKVEALGEVAGGIAHDFNNVLATIGGAVQMIQLQSENDKISKYLDMMDEAMTRGESITERLLTFTRSTAPQVEPISLQSFLYDLKELIQPTLPITIRMEIGEYSGQDLVAAEKTQLQQVLMNMCINASHAMNSGGVITLALRKASDKEVRTHVPTPDTDYLCITVSDTGQGMPESVRQRIFEPFFTTKELGQGTGLGLAIAHKIIQNHNGWIDVDSDPGKGTTFTIGLPATDEIIQSTIPEKTLHDFTAGGEHIFIIEDESPIRDVLQDTFESVGFTVSVAGNGQEGIDRVNAMENSVDVLVTDLGLPDMSGEEAAALIRKRRPDIPLIAITGYVDEEKYQMLHDKGFRAILKKPFDLQEVLMSVFHALE